MQRIEAGYVAWRGTVSENIASHETKKVSGSLLSIHQRPGTQIFTHAYLYPLPRVRKQQPIVRRVHDPSQRRCPTTRTTPSKLGLVQRLRRSLTRILRAHDGITKAPNRVTLRSPRTRNPAPGLDSAESLHGMGLEEFPCYGTISGCVI